MAEQIFDVFLAHNSKDKPLIRQIYRKLKERGINPWLDEEAIVPGTKFQDAIQQGIGQSKTVAVCIGKEGLGRWQNLEQKAVITQCVERGIRVIPVLLPGIEVIPDDLIFLKEFNAVLFQTSIDDEEGLFQLKWGITGRKPRKKPGSAQTEKPRIVTPGLKVDGLESKKGKNYAPLPDVNVVEKTDDFDKLIQQVREHCRRKILNQHSQIRLLSGEEIEVDQLYVDVYLLDKPEHKHFNSPESLLKVFDIEEDRLALSKRIDRNRGFDIANEKSKPVILGKPGSGKTTFLKHLAVDWCNGKFQPELIAILIELRRIQDEKWDLLNAVDKELELYNWQQFSGPRMAILKLKEEINNPKNKDKERQIERQLVELGQQLKPLPLQRFLTQGKLLILMDGLDEVPKNELRDKLQEQIRQVSKDYPNNRFILTCRTQVIRSIPVRFISVEVADFNSDQVGRFVQNWFKASGQSEAKVKQAWEKINSTVASQPDLRELTGTPVLLSLMCLVLQDEGELPSDRTWLYKKGIKLLLSKWNDEKQIDRWEIGAETYRKLKIEDKEALLTEIAARKFENPKNFVLFEQEELADQITQRLQLANRREGLAVLKSIAAQHGLLIERADELWSFSHLTFQEYFTVQWLTQLSSKELAKKIANHQWQGVVKQLVKSQQPADRLLKLIKQAIEQSIAREPAMQHFLDWLFQKSKSIQINYKPTAIRAFYYDLYLTPDHDLYLARALARARNRDHKGEDDCNLTLATDLARNLALDLYLARDLDLDLALSLSLSLTPDLTSADLALTLARDHAYTYDPDLTSKLQQLRGALPVSNNRKSFYEWRQANGAKWVEQLRQIMIEHRNMGHDWQFADEQTKQLERYYDANRFLVDLIKIEGAVSNDVRAEIEDTLFLPWAELQRRQPGIYRDLK